jgi:hypothetical protein
MLDVLQKMVQLLKGKLSLPSLAAKEQLWVLVVVAFYFFSYRIQLLVSGIVFLNICFSCNLVFCFSGFGKESAE